MACGRQRSGPTTDERAAPLWVRSVGGTDIGRQSSRDARGDPRSGSSDPNRIRDSQARREKGGGDPTRRTISPRLTGAGSERVGPRVPLENGSPGKQG